MSDDLFSEAYEERAAIMEHEAGLPREQAESMARADVLVQLHACEVRSLVAKYRKDGGEAVKDFLSQVAKHRGQAAADRLRTDALAQLRELK